MIKHGDLDYILKPYIEVGMYDPKSGSSEEVIVLNVYLKEEDAVEHLETFFNYMPLKNFIDVSCSNYIDDEGYYIIFVELSNNDETFNDVVRIMYEIFGITNFDEIKVKMYKKESVTITPEKVKSFYK